MSGNTLVMTEKNDHNFLELHKINDRQNTMCVCTVCTDCFIFFYREKRRLSKTLQLMGCF